MVYLVIIVLVAAAGIGRLWWIQHRLATSLQTVDGFRASLERLSGQESGPPVDAGTRRTPSPAPSEDQGFDPYRATLSPERRAAAKRRLEARRRGALRSSDLRSR